MILLWVCVIAVFSAPQRGDVGGRVHGRFGTMDEGGDGQTRHEPLIVSGWAMGSAVIALFVVALMAGVRPSNGQPRPVDSIGLTWLAVGAVLFEATFAMMCLAYWRSLARLAQADALAGEAEFAAVEFWGPFPTGLSWMLFGIWTVPVVFIAAYVFLFSHWIYPVESRERFGELLDQSRSHQRWSSEPETDHA